MEDLADSGKFGSKDMKYLQRLLLASYINEYEIFDTLYYFFRDSFFGVQIPNPFPGLIARLEIQALKYDLFEANIAQIKDVLVNPLNEDNMIKQGNKMLKNVYNYSIFFLFFWFNNILIFKATNQMTSLNIPAIISVEKIVSFFFF